VDENVRERKPTVLENGSARDRVDLGDGFGEQAPVRVDLYTAEAAPTPDTRVLAVRED
jgi:hypothetical protein